MWLQFDHKWTGNMSHQRK